MATTKKTKNPLKPAKQRYYLVFKKRTKIEFSTWSTDTINETRKQCIRIAREHDWNGIDIYTNPGTQNQRYVCGIDLKPELLMTRYEMINGKSYLVSRKIKSDGSPGKMDAKLGFDEITRTVRKLR